MKKLKQHLLFLFGLIIVPIINWYDWYTSKYVYIWITLPQWYIMVYKHMDRLSAIKYLEERKFYA